MPLNTLRLNHQPSTHPNDRIVFIKPLARPPSDQASYDIADTLLRAIAAQCLPVMKKHHLSVTTLEEHEWNREFIGRNFNNGEIIQLVLQDRNGRFVGFSVLQMVMQHELAHNLHMNHGKLFWQTRNLFSQEIRDLWARGYTGEGFWGNGRTLNEMQAIVGNNLVRSEELEGLPLCGGTYRSRRRKRKARGTTTNDLTWKEKRDGRIEKKFGKNGVSLGEDEDRRMMLEIGKKGPIGGKPRVAQSKRGRELRAAAALARFQTNEQEVDNLKKEEDESENEDEEYEDVDADLADARGVDGQRILDSRGHGMVRVCNDEDEDTDQVNVKQELQELEELDRSSYKPQKPWTTESINEASSSGTTVPPMSDADKKRKALYDIPEHRNSPPPSPSPSRPPSKEASMSSPTSKSKPKITIHRLPKTSELTSTTNPSTSSAFIPERPIPITSSSTSSTPNSLPSASAPIPGSAPRAPPPLRPQVSQSSMTNCPICSMINPHLSATCQACAHVLDPNKDPSHWRCGSEACQNSEYINAGDAGVCGVCGGRREIP